MDVKHKLEHDERNGGNAEKYAGDINVEPQADNGAASIKATSK